MFVEQVDQVRLVVVREGFLLVLLDVEVLDGLALLLGLLLFSRLSFLLLSLFLRDRPLFFLLQSVLFDEAHEFREFQLSLVEDRLFLFVDNEQGGKFINLEHLLYIIFGTLDFAELGDKIFVEG